MLGTANTEFKLGQQYWCVARQLSTPLLGSIIGLTDVIGKTIGLEFVKNIGGHSCDGRGKNGYCLWVTTQVIYDETEWENVAEILSAQKEFTKILAGNDYETLVINRATGLPDVATINSSDNEQSTTKNLIHAVDE